MVYELYQCSLLIFESYFHYNYYYHNYNNDP